MVPEAEISAQPAPGQWRDAVYELTEFERPSASEGERRAAEWIAERLRALGAEVEIEEGRAHGGYWWPIALANLLSARAGLLALRRRGKAGRAAAAAVSAICAAGLWDDFGHGRRWFRRALMPHRSTWNVVAEMGDQAAKQTIVVVAHHDAARSGLIFHPALGQIGPRYLPQIHERSNQTIPVMYGTWLGPLMTGLGALVGARRLIGLGVVWSLGATLAMLDIARSPVVPGANDNLAAVGILLALAEKLAREPASGVRVLLVSTGSEESFSEGMQAFGERHFDELDREHTEFLALECLGGPNLTVLEGEGMLKMRHYPEQMRDALAEAATRAGVRIGRGLRTVAATDAIIPLRAGYPAVALCAVTEAKLPLNYHWPSDVPEALHWETVEQAIAVCEHFLRRHSDGV